MSGIQSWGDPGQNRESGGRESERTGYASPGQDCDDPNPATDGGS